MHIGQFVLSWTANLSFSRDEQILENILANRLDILFGQYIRSCGWSR